MQKIQAMTVNDDTLHWLVAKAQGLITVIDVLDDTVKPQSPRLPFGQKNLNTRIRLLCKQTENSKNLFEPNYSYDGRLAQKIIEEHRIASHWNENLKCWSASINGVLAYSCTHLRACMVCYVIYYFGSIVEVPPSLLNGSETPAIEKKDVHKIQTITDINQWLKSHYP